MACASVDGNVVTITYTAVITERHADIGVMILEPWRGRSFATFAASLVAEGVQRVGLVPVWTTTDGDFAEVSRRTMISVAPQGL